MAECLVLQKGRYGRKNSDPKVTKARMPKAMRLEAAIVEPTASHVVHVCKFNYNNLDERHAFLVRMEDVLTQGFAVAIKKIDPKAERLLARYPGH